jgi:hypothetical protein
VANWFFLELAITSIPAILLSFPTLTSPMRSQK